MFEINLYSLNIDFDRDEFSSWYVADNFYDPYTRARNLKYIRENSITKIFSQDNDLSYLRELPEIECLQCSQESNHIEALYSLKKLRILSLTTDDTSFDFAKLSPSLSVLVTTYESKNKTWMNHSGLTALIFRDYRTEDLSWLRDFPNKDQIRALEIAESFGGFNSLNGIEALSGLEFLSVRYCRRLEDVSSLAALHRLRILHWYDNPKAEDLPYLHLRSLEELSVMDCENVRPKRIPTLSFLNGMPALKKFSTDRTVADRDLTPLFRLQRAELGAYVRGYNVRPGEKPNIIFVP